MRTSIQKTSGFLFLALGLSHLLMVIFLTAKENLIGLQVKKSLKATNCKLLLSPEIKLYGWMLMRSG